MAKLPQGFTPCGVVEDFLGNRINKGDLVLVAAMNASSPAMWLGLVQDLVEKPGVTQTYGNGQSYETAAQFKVLIEPAHPKAYSGYRRHSWPSETNHVSGEVEFVGYPKPVWIMSDNVVRYLRVLTPILEGGLNG